MYDLPEADTNKIKVRGRIFFLRQPTARLMEAWGCHELSHEMWGGKAKRKECRALRGRK